jgi:hypothetical protein
MNHDTREDFVWLLSDEAASILERVRLEFEERTNPVRIAKTLRKDTSATRCALVMEQAQLRIRGQRKFSRADKMFFTRRGYEQASGKRIAEYKASRFARLENVADVCCGIGGDLIELSRRARKLKDRDSLSTRTVGVELDELTCLFANRNLKVYSQSPKVASIEQVDFADFDLKQLDGLHVDPDRRVAKRTVQGNRFSPSLESVFERAPKQCSLAVKVAPATPWGNYFPPEIQREWIGDHRECKQQMLWLGEATDKPGHRTATCVHKDGSFSQISVAESDLDQTMEVGDSVKQYIYEPHPAVLASKLTDFVAARHGLHRFTSSIAYLTGKSSVDDPLLTQFEVLDVFKLSLRQTHRVLKHLEVGEIEVKKRGIETVTAAQFIRLKLEGPNKATVFLTRLGKTRIAIVAKRMDNPLMMPDSKSKE